MRNFKSFARRHQEQFLKNVLKCDPMKDLPCMLRDEDARLGRIFYDGFEGFLDKVKARYSYNDRKSMYANMLRSEHIPFNFFVPFMINHRAHHLARIFNSIIEGLELTQIDEPIIEYAPPVKEKHLNDLTSFDVYVKGKNGSKIIGFGIEVKYTEASYPYGAQEYNRMFDSNEASLYHKVSRESQIYLDGAISFLRKKELKQAWRNHLLGLSMKKNGDIDEFYSILLYPSQNDYQNKVCEKYKALLKPQFQHLIIGLTYEDFINVVLHVCVDDPQLIEWIKYIERRYIVTTSMPTII